MGHTKIFARRGEMKLISDKRDIMLPMKMYNKVKAWCLENDIEADMAPANPFTQTMFEVTLWRVKNEKDRTFFLLKWSDANSDGTAG